MGTRSRITSVGAVFLALSASLLGGCSGPLESTGGGSSGGQSVVTPPETSGRDDTNEGFPSCDEVKAVLGTVVEELVELEGSENGVATGAEGPELGCAWHTTETADGSTDLAEYGGISIGISRDPEYTEEAMAPLGWNVEDARVSAVDAWAVKVGGQYDPAAQLDVTGVQVVRDGVVVVLTSGGVALQDVPQLAPLTNEWALGAGVAILETMD